MRTPIIAGNWKLHMNPDQTTEFVNAVKDKLPDPNKVESLICAPAVDLDALRKAAKGSNLHIGAENAQISDSTLFGSLFPYTTLFRSKMKVLSLVKPHQWF